MKKYLLIFFIAAISIFLSSCSESENSRIFSGFNPEDNQTALIRMDAKTDKSVYSSFEKVILDVKITSNQELNDVLISAKGISAFGKNYFNKNQSINLTKQKRQELKFIETLPSCNSCSGLRPGSYTISISASLEGKILSEEIISINIKQ